jgi:hypothetical protein
VQAAYSLDPWKAFWGKAPLIGTIFFVLGWIALLAGLVAELVMRAGFEFNAGRYWDEARRVNFGAATPRDEREPVTREVDEATRRFEEVAR